MIRIHIDGNWTAMEFAEFFSAISIFYFLPYSPGQVELKWSADEHQLMWTADGAPMYWTTDASDENQIFVSAIKFASPGFTDLAGAAAALKELRLFIQYLCERRSRNNIMEMEVAERKARVDLIRSLVLASPSQELSQRSMAMLMQENSPLLDLIALKKITGVSEIGEDSA